MERPEDFKSLCMVHIPESVGKYFSDAVEVREGISDFFNGLMSIVAGGDVRSGFPDEHTGSAVRDYVMGWLGSHPLDGFDEYSDDSYVRTYIGKSRETGWEAIVMTWKQGCRTTIHGHPCFASYNFADGTFQVEIFEKVSDGTARLVDKVVVDSPEGFYAIGKAGTFDNHIHRITCLSPTGHSLHVYSDDARRGLLFSAED